MTDKALEALGSADFARLLRRADERERAAEQAYDAALERGGTQDECNAAAEAAETAYDECASRQRQSEK